ncbi:unnamed protein product [Ilex paraguariensis]|uniref:Transmembrane protein n=1 Tax=Ilex paraguariensis TaxID=185542 RepID=A0ABC8RRZ6_9AQUA
MSLVLPFDEKGWFAGYFCRWRGLSGLSVVLGRLSLMVYGGWAIGFSMLVSVCVMGRMLFAGLMCLGAAKAGLLKVLGWCCDQSVIWFLMSLESWFAGIGVGGLGRPDVASVAV